MRKRIAFSLVIVFLITGSVAQAQFSYGAKLGMGFPGFRDDSIASQRITLTAGLVGSFKIINGIQLMTEVCFQRKGNKYQKPFLNTKPDSTYLVKTNLDYINIPLYLRVNLGSSSKFYFQAGGYYGYLVHANFTGKRSGEMIKKVNIMDGLYHHDYGIIAGGGIETSIRQGFGVVLDVKYQWGMKNLNKDKLIIGNSNPIRNKGLAMSMGFYVDIE
ncbi:MAG: porin family protein [Bacteroidia bacterium]|nr:porin family protein [Bacteroidia bacterium]